MSGMKKAVIKVLAWSHQHERERTRMSRRPSIPDAEPPSDDNVVHFESPVMSSTPRLSTAGTGPLPTCAGETFKVKSATARKSGSDECSRSDEAVHGR